MVPIISANLLSPKLRRSGKKGSLVIFGCHPGLSQTPQIMAGPADVTSSLPKAHCKLAYISSYYQDSTLHQRLRAARAPSPKRY
ncbi:hypothetical protein PoB_005235900 [Plakobranchus ocellatus]|uniref:Uncharacterized protein n=1 Tax=Plakobranchus ocellatus TaxID=259542 RepID=A0AAV4C3Z4_9GAST|nr:hypothetical protein PoB_005235900 [Plakobranchus ocellatus]